MTEEQVTPELAALMRAEQVAPILAWLISESCTQNGDILVCGGGKLSRARMMETGSLSVPSGLDFKPEILESLVRKLEGQPLDRAHKSGLKQFASFMGIGL